MSNGSSDSTCTAYSSPSGVLLGAAGEVDFFRGREIPSLNSGLRMGGLCFRAMTFGTETGVTSDAFPTRRNLDPG